METKFASYFKEMEFARQHTFEGGRIQGGQPSEEVYTTVTRTFFTKEKYVSLFQYTERISYTDRRIVAGEYWLCGDLTVWQVPLANAETFSLSRMKKIDGHEAVDILSIANSNGSNPEWDELLKCAIKVNK